jgi:hypothetical protein
MRARRIRAPGRIHGAMDQQGKVERATGIWKERTRTRDSIHLGIGSVKTTSISVPWIKKQERTSYDFFFKTIVFLPLF